MGIKKKLSLLMACLIVISFSGCMNRGKSFVVYEPFKGEYTTDCFDVSCNWETLNPLLEKCNFGAYGLYPVSADASVFRFEDSLNLIAMSNYSPTDANFVKAIAREAREKLGGG